MVSAITSSIYQDVALHSLEEFFELAPEELRTEDVRENEHQLMLNRLTFELNERQRYVLDTIHIMSTTSHWLPLIGRLEQKRKELTQQKEELLKQSKTKATIEDNVKSQIESLVKVCTILLRFPLAYSYWDLHSKDCYGHPEEN